MLDFGQDPESRGLLVKERVAKISKLRSPPLLESCVVNQLVGLNRLVPKDKKIYLANQPTVHSGGVSRGRVSGCGCWHLVTGDR